MGWTRGFEPATVGATVRCSTNLSYAHRKILACLRGFEPPTRGLEVRRSIQLSYRQIGGSSRGRAADRPGGRLVGARGFEPPTTCAQGRCATRLRHAPSPAAEPSGSQRTTPLVGTKRYQSVCCRQAGVEQIAVHGSQLSVPALHRALSRGDAPATRSRSGRRPGGRRLQHSCVRIQQGRAEWEGGGLAVWGVWGRTGNGGLRSGWVGDGKG